MYDDLLLLNGTNDDAASISGDLEHGVYNPYCHGPVRNGGVPMKEGLCPTSGFYLLALIERHVARFPPLSVRS